MAARITNAAVTREEDKQDGGEKLPKPDARKLKPALTPAPRFATHGGSWFV
jgi:hypothetical protein